MSTRAAGAPQRLHIDWTRCEGRGACIELLEGMLVADADGFPLAPHLPSSERSHLPIAPADLPAAREAVARCPRLALSLRSERE